jgi:hypothetical protein
MDIPVIDTHPVGEKEGYSVFFRLAIPTVIRLKRRPVPAHHPLLLERECVGEELLGTAALMYP